VVLEETGKMYSWVFFDWDGCIADTLRIWVRAYEQTLPNYGINASAQDIWRKLQLGNVPKQYAVSDQLQCRTDTRKVAMALFEDVALYDNAKDSLMTIANQCELGIVSNSPSELLYSVLGRYKIKDLFSSIIAKEDAAELKPHPGGILKAMELLQADPRKTLFVGDSDKDLDAARRAGIDSVLFYPEEHELLYELKQLESHKPTYVVRSFKELEYVVAGRGV
jgi:HAD superfamily hydrolase (TIGR01509 family)